MNFDTWFLSKNTNFPLGTLNGLLSIDSKELACLFVRVGIPLVAQMVKHLPTMRETWVQSLGRENPLEKQMATHSNTLAWKIPWKEPGGLQSMGSQRVRHVWATSLSLSLCSCTVYPVKIMLAISVRIHYVLILEFNTQVTFDIFFSLFLLPSVLKEISRFIFSGIVSEL